MLEKIKNNKWLFWLVPIVLLLSFFWEQLAFLVVKRAKKDYNLTKEENTKLEKQRLEIEKQAVKHTLDAEQAIKKVNELKNTDNYWYKNITRKDDGNN